MFLRDRALVGFVCVSLLSFGRISASEKRYSLDLEHATSVVSVINGLAFLAGDDTLTIVDLATAQQLARIQIADAKITAVAISTTTLCVAGSAQVEYGFCATYNLAKLIKAVRSPEYVQAKDAIGVLSRCEQFRIDSLDQRLSAVAVASSDEGERIIAGDERGKLTCFDTLGKQVWETSPHNKGVLSLMALSDGTVASGDWTGKITISELAEGQEYESFKQHRGRITQLQALKSDGGPRLYSASTDGTLRLWYPHQSRLVRFARLPQSVLGFAAVSEDRVIALTKGGQIQRLDMLTTKVMRAIDSEIEFAANIAASRNWTVVTDARGHVAVFEGSLKN